jgi:hypothetical protein
MPPDMNKGKKLPLTVSGAWGYVAYDDDNAMDAIGDTIQKWNLDAPEGKRKLTHDFRKEKIDACLDSCYNMTQKPTTYKWCHNACLKYSLDHSKKAAVSVHQLVNATTFAKDLHDDDEFISTWVNPGQKKRALTLEIRQFKRKLDEMVDHEKEYGADFIFDES